MVNGFGAVLLFNWNSKKVCVRPLLQVQEEIFEKKRNEEKHRIEKQQQQIKCSAWRKWRNTFPLFVITKRESKIYNKYMKREKIEIE